MATRWLRSCFRAVSCEAATAADEVCSSSSRCAAEQRARTASTWAMCSANPRCGVLCLVAERALRFVSVLNALEEYLFAAGVINQSLESLQKTNFF